MAQLPQIITGTVKRNLGRGHDLGYPTANIDYSGDLSDGVYFGHTTVGELHLPSLIFIGSSITFNEVERRMEIYILDFDGDLYEKEIQVVLEKKSRDNMKFESAEALIEQMKEDERLGREYFSHTKNTI